MPSRPFPVYPGFLKYVVPVQLPLAVSDAARTGDADAVEQVLRYYEGYINKLCTRTVYDESGCPHACLDEYMKSRLENKLIRAILGEN